MNLEARTIFYAGFQAIMYVLCFRMRSILGVPHFKSQLLQHIEYILRHPLNQRHQLQVYLPSIVEEFWQLVKANCLFDELKTTCDYIVIDSKPPRASGEIKRREKFSPFDCYLLNKSNRYIRPNLVTLSMVGSIYDEDDDEEESASDEDVANAFAGENEMNLADDKRSVFGGKILKLVQMPPKIGPSTRPQSL